LWLLFYQPIFPETLQVRLDTQKSPKEEPLTQIFLAGCQLFLSPSQQCQSTEVILINYNYSMSQKTPLSLPGFHFLNNYEKSTGINNGRITA